MKLILLLLLVLIIILILCSNKEKFTYSQKKINAAIIFTGYNIDEWDYNFIKRWYKDIKIYVIHNKDDKSNDEKWLNKIRELNGIIIMERPNIGWDATAWKEAIIKYYKELKKYDEVFLMNNSMNYEKIDMKQMTELANQYDLYGIYYTQLTKHIDSYFMGFNKYTFNSKDFKRFYFENFPLIESHMDAVVKYEMEVSKYFSKLGYRFGSFIPDKRPHTNTYMKYPDFVDLDEVKWITKKAHLKSPTNYNKWKKL